MHTSNSPVPLTSQQCWDLLRTARVCRVAYSDRALPAIASLPCTTDGARIILNAPEGSPEHAAMRGSVIAFQVESIEPSDDAAWSITCIGQANPARTSPDGPPLLAFQPELLEGRRLAVLPITTASSLRLAAAPAR
jgi:hypothetical protein